MNICTVANQKGGVGKTTSVAAIGGILADRGYRVLVIDCDPQASLTAYFGFDSEQLSRSLFDLFEADQLSQKLVATTIMQVKTEKLSLLPASLSLATLDKRFGSREGMGLVVKRSLALVKDDFDYVLIDCPPILGMLMINALAACRCLLIPVQTEFLAIKGLQRMMETLNMVIKAQHHSIEYRIVPTMFDRRTRASIKALRNMRDDFGHHLWSKVIPVDTKLRDASQANRTPASIFPTTHGVMAYHKLADVMIAMLTESRVA